MTGRTLLALFIAPIVAGAVFATVVMSTVPLSAIPVEHRPEFLTQAWGGVVVGALFELFFLLPLLYALNRTRLSGRLLFIFLGTLVWFLASLALFSLSGRDWNGRLTTAVMFLVPGFALVVAFGVIVRHGAKA